jgi:LacI family transcriptional regulator
MRERATIGLVAKRAQVAASTVSRVLNGGYASPESRARVEAAIKELGFSPSPAAKSLRLGRAGTIGVVVETSQGAWFTQLLGGIEEELVLRKASVLLGSLALRGHYDSAAVEAWIRERRVDGVIIVRYGKRERTLLNGLQKVGLPCVFIAPDERVRTSLVVRAQNREAGEKVAHHLLAFGHRQFWYVGGPADSVDSQERLEGLVSGLAVEGVTLRAGSVLSADSYRAEDAIPAAHRWLKVPRKQAPTAVVLANDALAFGFMRVLLQAGVGIPEEVSITGFDGVPEGALCWPGLTSMAQPVGEMGRYACNALMEMIEARTTRPYATRDFPMELTVRESTGPAPGVVAEDVRPAKREAAHRLGEKTPARRARGNRR